MQFSSRIDTGPRRHFSATARACGCGKAAARGTGRAAAPGRICRAAQALWCQKAAPRPALNWCKTLMTMGKSRPGALC